MSNLIPKTVFLDQDVVKMAKFLIGKKIITHIDGVRISGIITETEAYRAPEDKGSHAYNNKRTERTQTFYMEGGHLYVYLCNGVHALTNIITGPEDVPHAVLLRAIEPIDGVEIMMQRRGKSDFNKTLTSGPGSLSVALGLNLAFNAYHFVEDPNQVSIEYADQNIHDNQIVTTTRIGLESAGEWANMPWRFYLKDTKWVSKK